MKTRARTKRQAAAAVQPAFWDTSGIVPLCCHQPASSQANRNARLYGNQLVWWAAPVEAVSAINRLMREGALTAEQVRQALHRLDYLRRRWSEIQPTEELRTHAERLLRPHSLRAADALQLAAALVWCNNRPRGRHFIGADNALLGAAETEGFSVIRLFS
jgi:hypothetical protein